MQPPISTNKCFQFFITKIATKQSDLLNGKSELVMKTDNEVTKIIDALLSNWETITVDFMNGLSRTCRQRNTWPWAIALFPKEYRLAGHVVSIRKHMDDFSFGSYSLGKGPLSKNEGVPPFSYLLVHKKTALADAAKKSLLFEQAWNLLKDKDENLHWICLPSSPPANWVSKISADDDTLFMKAIRKMQPISHVETVRPPRKILAEHFKSLGGELPINGAWGYSKDDACIIDKNDPIVDNSVPFDGVGLEYIFVEKRIYEELIISRQKGEKFSGIKWKLREQQLVHDGDRSFDRLIYEITAFPDKDWEELKAEYEGPQGFEHPEFDIEAHERKRQERMVRFTREFWFDISSFFGQDLIIPEKQTGKKNSLS